MYFPWPGFIGQMALADVYIWLDDAQFSKGSFTNRVQVKTARGQSWMSVPLAGKGAFQQLADLAPADERWRGGHRDLLRQQLSDAPYLTDALGLYDEVQGQTALIDLLIASAEVPARYCDALPSKILRSSQLNVPGTSSQRVCELVDAVGGTRYLTGHGAAAYLDHTLFEDAGIEVVYMDYAMPQWRQAYGDFTHYVTILDPIAWLGPAARDVLPAATVDWKPFLAQRAARV